MARTRGFVDLVLENLSSVIGNLNSERLKGYQTHFLSDHDWQLVGTLTLIFVQGGAGLLSQTAQLKAVFIFHF